jgi:hypothetical protein
MSYSDKYASKDLSAQWFGLISGLHQLAERGMQLMFDKLEPLKLHLQKAHQQFLYGKEEFPSLLQTIEK